MDLLERLEALLSQNSEDHHVAFRATDGVDPDWAIWYVSHLLENGFDKRLDSMILRSDLIYLLVEAHKESRPWRRPEADGSASTRTSPSRGIFPVRAVRAAGSLGTTVS